MKRFTLATALAAGMAVTTALPAHAQDETVTIEFAYPYSHLFDVTYEKIMPKFKKQHPDIEVKFRAVYESYEDGTNTILREATAGTLPDVTMQGLNRQAILVEKGIAKSLEPYIAKEADFAKDGYHKAMLDLGTFDGKVHGLPFSVSLPVGYYNMDLLKKAGITELPTTWDETIAACKAMKEAGVANPMFWGWNITGNWFAQALMWSQDEPTIKDAKFNMDGEAGLTALSTMNRLFSECEMKNLEWKEALASFSSGDIAMMFWSTSALGAVERSQGEFELKTGPFPGLEASGPKGLPAGGNSAMLVSQSDDPKVLDAAWKWAEVHHVGRGRGGRRAHDRLHAAQQGRQRDHPCRLLQGEPEQADGRRPAAPAARMAGLSRRQRAGDHAGALRTRWSRW